MLYTVHDTASGLLGIKLFEVDDITEQTVSCVIRWCVGDLLLKSGR